MHHSEPVHNAARKSSTDLQSAKSAADEPDPISAFRQEHPAERVHADTVMRLQRMIGNQAVARLVNGRTRGGATLQRVELSSKEEEEIKSAWKEKGLDESIIDQHLEANRKDSNLYKERKDLEAKLQEALDQQEEEPEGLVVTPDMKVSAIAQAMGFTHVAHFTQGKRFPTISNSGNLDKPESSGAETNFDPEEYNNAGQIFLGLVNAENLEPLKHYGDHVFLFDLSLLDQRDDYFVNTMFTGTYTQKTGAKPSDERIHMAEILYHIATNGNKNEVVFQNKIKFQTAPLRRIRLLGGPPKSVYLQYEKFYGKVYAKHGISLTLGKNEFIIAHV